MSLTTKIETSDPRTWEWPPFDFGPSALGKLLELNYATVTRTAEHYLSYLESLAQVRDIAGFVERQQNFVEKILCEQAGAMEKASEILFNTTASKAEAPIVSAAGAQRKTPAPAADTSIPAEKTADVTSLPVKKNATAVPDASASLAFEIYLDQSGEYRYRLQAVDGSALLTSQGYKSRSSVGNGIASARKNAADDDRYDMQDSATGKPSFNLKAGNNRVIASSRTFASSEQCNAAVALIKQAVGAAKVIDLSAES